MLILDYKAGVGNWWPEVHMQAPYSINVACQLNKKKKTFYIYGENMTKSAKKTSK